MKKLLNIALIGILGITITLTFTQLSISVSAGVERPLCASVKCSTPHKCGTECFCNNPYGTEGTCYDGGDDLPN